MTNDNQGSVLVLDGQFNSALAIIRALGKRGLRVLLASPDAVPLASRSRYCEAHYRYPDPSASSAEFVDAVVALVERLQPDLVIPVTEKTLIPLAENRTRFPAATRLALAPDNALATVLDKQATAELAVSLDIPTPRSVHASTPHELACLADHLDFPLVLKPIRSVSRKNGRIGPQLTVSYAFDQAQLTRLAEPLLEHGGVVAQEYFRGEGVGVELIADHGEAYYLFQHRRLHELPLSGGGSCLRRSETVDPVLAEAATRLVKAIGWHGVAMVEFKRDRATGAYRLIEINGRFWGSLPLSVAAGADFPWLTWQLFIHQRRASLSAAAPGVTCRDLRKDLYWHEYVLRRVTDPRLFGYPTTRELLSDLSTLFSPRHHLDSFYWKDPLPALVELGRIITHYGKRVRERLIYRQTVRRHERAWRNGRVSAALQRSRRILILCYGNINRSAAAHAYLAQRLPAAGAIDVCSAGFHPEGARPADPNMVAVGGERGVAMADWRSTVLTRELLDRADLIFVMEVAHLARVAELNAAAVSRCYLWGAALTEEGEAVEIGDPYGKSLADYRHCFERLVRAADKMFVDK